MALYTRLLVSAAFLVPYMLAQAEEKDPVKEKLFRAKLAYDTEMREYRKLASDWFEKREDGARKDGNKKLVDQIKVERKAFDEEGKLPKGVPASIQQKPATVRKSLEAAYAQAVKDYTIAKKDDQAAAVEKELDEFKKGDAVGIAKEPTDDGFGAGTKLVGTQSVSYTGKNGKKVVGGTDVEVTVKKRAGNEFTAEIWTNKGMAGYQVEGTIEKGQVKYRMTKALTDTIARHEVGNTFFTGRFEKGSLTGIFTMPKTNPTFKGEIKVKSGKE
jgi:hypothetical protein